MKKIKNIFLIMMVGMAIFSCTDELADLNVDPNEPVDVPASNLLTSAEFNFFNLLAGSNLNTDWGMLMTQQFAEDEYTSTSRYDVDGNSFNGTFLTLYASVLNELKFAKNKIEVSTTLTDAEKANQIAIIDILSSYAYQVLTDGFGAIPYTESLQPTEFPNPKYDSQEVVYKGILDTYLNAVNSIDTSAGSFSEGEIIFDGDMAMWKKFGNSLMLRAAMRYAERNESEASTYIQAASNDLITDNSMNALMQFGNSQEIANPFYVNDITRDDARVTELLVETLTAINDPRLEQYAEPNLQGDIVGMPYGLPDGDAFALKNVTSRPNTQTTRLAETPYVIIGAAEVQFLLAEAYERGLLSGNAETAYNEGVTQSMNRWGITNGISDYLMNNSYDSNNWVESIGLQKWLALYMNGYEGWSEQRRLDYPELQAPAAAIINEIPKKLPYPISEQTNNSSNLSEVSSDFNSMTEKVWWDVN